MRTGDRSTLGAALWVAMVLLALAVLPGCASPPAPPPDLDRRDEAAVQAYLTRLITYEMDRSSTPGMSIAVVDDQRVVWQAGFGDADLEHGARATAQTLYRVGSISKLLTDVAAMQLVEQGRLDLDRPLQTYLPEFSIRQRDGLSAAITPRQLMSHHSGLPRDRLKGYASPNPQPFETLAGELGAEFAAYPPGLIFSYSNLGVSLLGSAVQRVAGEPFADYLQHAVLAPAGMATARFETGAAPGGGLAGAYQGRERRLEPPIRDLPAGGLTASAADLAHFMAMIFAGGAAGPQRILAPESVREMFRPQNQDVALDLNFRVGLGWMLSTLGSSTIQGGGVVAHHAGAMEYHRSQLYLLPEHKLGVVVLANSSTSTQAVDHVANEALALALEVKTGVRQQPLSPLPLAPRAAPVATLAPHEGDYTTVAGPARIRLDGDHLRVEFAGLDFSLLPRSDGLFALDFKLLGLFHPQLGELSTMGFAFREVGGHDILVARVGDQEMLAGDKLAAPVPSPSWQRRLGDYEIVNLGADHRFADKIRLSEDRGRLLLELKLAEAPDRTQRSLVLPLSDTEALLLGALNGAGESIRIELGGGEEQLLFSGYRARRIGH